jgi:hypothetical protein
MPTYIPEEVSRFLQNAIDTAKDENGRMIIILSTQKKVIVSVRDWNDYLLSLEDEITDDDYLFHEDQSWLDSPPY